MRKILLVLLVLTLIGINHVNCRRSGPKSHSIEEEEDFSEFDSMLDEEVQIPLKRNNNEKRKSANDFTEFDVNNKDGEDEDFEEESEDLNYFDTNSDDKPKQDKSAERINSASNENKKRDSSFNNLNVDDLDMEEFEHFIGIYNLKKRALYFL